MAAVQNLYSKDIYLQFCFCYLNFHIIKRKNSPVNSSLVGIIIITTTKAIMIMTMTMTMTMTMIMGMGMGIIIDDLDDILMWVEFSACSCLASSTKINISKLQL